MKKQKYTVKLSEEERKELETFIKSRSPHTNPTIRHLIKKSSYDKI